MICPLFASGQILVALIEENLQGSIYKLRNINERNKKISTSKTTLTGKGPK
jgi:hypothetical protein